MSVDIFYFVSIKCTQIPQFAVFFSLHFTIFDFKIDGTRGKILYTINVYENQLLLIVFDVYLSFHKMNAFFLFFIFLCVFTLRYILSLLHCNANCIFWICKINQTEPNWTTLTQNKHTQFTIPALRFRSTLC